MALTDKKVQAAKATGQRYSLSDGKVEGLELRVGATGKRSWSLVYRFHGERRRMPVGKGYPTTGLNDARQLARDALQLLGRGVDPGAKQKAEAEALRMVDLLGDGEDEDPKAGKYTGWYLSDYVRSAGKLGAAKTAKGISNDRYYIKGHLRDRKALMRKRVDEVTAADLNAIKAAVTPSTWRKLRNILLVCFRHAEDVGAIGPGTNPVLRTKAGTDPKRQRFLTPEERQRLEETFAKAEELGSQVEGGLSRHIIRALRLLALTGMRRSEVLALRWEWIDWRHARINLPTSKTGAKEVPLTPQAVTHLKAQRGAAVRVGLVCCGDGGKPIHPENVGRAWRAIRETAKLPGVRLHDLRHSWASDAVSAGVPLYVVGKALGHTQPNTTARYSHLHDKAVKEGLAKAGAAIERATKGKGA
jgi:integrase